MDRREVLAHWLDEHQRGPTWLAQQIGVSREWISTVLSGRRPISDRLASRLSDALGILFDGDGQLSAPIVSAAPISPAAPTSAESEVSELIINPEPRCPCVIVLDGLLGANPELRSALARGLAALDERFRVDRLTGRRADLAFVAFDRDVRTLGSFSQGLLFADIPSHLSASAPPSTVDALAGALRSALDLLDSRQREYDRSGTEVYRAWVFLLLASDVDAPHRGDRVHPALHAAIKCLCARERAGLVSFFAVGIGDCRPRWLESTALRPALALRERRFPELFEWLAASLARVTSSIPGDRVPLPPTRSFTHA